jgi:Prokaryotic E2 family A/ThiF family
MTVDHWLAAFEIVDAASLVNPQALQVLAFLKRHAAALATVVELRREGTRDLIVTDMLTGTPQAPVYSIRKQERVGLLFADEDRLPFVVMLRDDFPDTEHQQVVPEGHPFVICIDDRPWSEARLTWTPAEFVDRIVWWFRRAARGELQDARQPLDPILAGSGLSFIVARSILDAPDDADLVGAYDAKFKNVLRVRRRAEAGPVVGGMDPVTVTVHRITPQRMERMRTAPVNLAGLAAWLNDRGINFLENLRARFAAAFDKGPAAAWPFQARFAVIVEMPILSPRDSRQTGFDVRAFITAQAAGDIAVSLGIALKQADRSEGSRVGFVKAIPARPVDDVALASIAVQSAEVNLEFERDLAARLSGRRETDTRAAVLLGAGAIGSHVADCLVREGRFTWTVIDDDQLLPHNLARHTALGAQVTRPKAEIAAERLNAVLSGPAIAQAVNASLFDTGSAADKISRTLGAADIIIDATASVVAARALSDGAYGARRISAFFNPSGEAAVLLGEPADRSLTLRDLEAQYFGLILRTPRLASHLGKEAETIAYTGACRAITSRIPESRASVLSGLAASGLSAVVDAPAGAISVWSLAWSGEVAFDSAPLEPVSRYKVRGWTSGRRRLDTPYP